MNSEDYTAFSKRWCEMTYAQKGRTLSDDELKAAVEFTFELLEDFTIDEVLRAIKAHCRVNGWVATPAEVIERIIGVRPTSEAMAGLCRTSDSVLGVFVHSLVGAHDVQQFNDEQLFKRIRSLKTAIDEFIDRAQFGDFTDKQIRMFAGREVDPSGRLCRGLRGPAGKYRAAVHARYQAEIKPAIAHEPMAERSEGDSAEGKKHLAELMLTLKGKPPTQSYQAQAQRKEKALRDLAEMKEAGVVL